MRFFFALAAYVVMGLVLVSGITHAVQGSYWLLIAGFLAYLLALIKLGCLPPKHH